MEVKQFRATSLQEALRRVRQELGPQAAVLQTREIPQGLWGWLGARREIEVTAALDVNVPARFPGSCPVPRRVARHRARRRAARRGRGIRFGAG